MVGKIQMHLRVSGDDEVGRWVTSGTIGDIGDSLGWSFDDCVERQRLEAIDLYFSRDAAGCPETDGGSIKQFKSHLAALEGRETKIELDATVSIYLY